MPYIVKKVCSLCGTLMSVSSVPNKPLMDMDTTHGMCPDTCGPAWHKAQMADVLPLLNKMEEEENAISIEIYDEDTNAWVPLDEFKMGVVLAGVHNI